MNRSALVSPHVVADLRDANSAPERPTHVVADLRDANSDYY
jgi:hypothetical protein